MQFEQNDAPPKPPSAQKLFNPHPTTNDLHPRDPHWTGVQQEADATHISYGCPPKSNPVQIHLKAYAPDPPGVPHMQQHVPGPPPPPPQISNLIKVVPAGGLQT